MKIIITASGQGSRFKKVGINKPKYMIKANNKSLFYWSLISFKNLFNEEFIFVFNKNNFDESFVKNELLSLGIKKYNFVFVDKTTDGQATSAFLCDKYLSDDDKIVIYNIDTSLNPSKITEDIFKHDGNVITANLPGDHWSFIKTDVNDIAIAASEKIRISDHASVGCYYFAKWIYFKEIYLNFKDEIIKKYKEAYICPMYQYMIKQKKQISIFEIKPSDIICLGTPDEVELFDKNYLKNNL